MVEKLNSQEVTDASLTDEQKQYYKFKLLYKQAKVERKLRLSQDCDDTCSAMLGSIKDKINVTEAHAHWKFIIKAAYMQVGLLTNVMEFAAPKKIINDIAEKALVKFLKKYYPEIMPTEVEEEKKAGEDGVPQSL